jgi:hypothetical protein
MAYTRDRGELPIVPHEFVGGKDCCGCLVAEFRGDEADLVCNECNAVIKTVPASDVESELSGMLLSQQDFTSAVCPHCGTINTFFGFSKMLSYICSECGEPVSLDPRLIIDDRWDWESHFVISKNSLHSNSARVKRSGTLRTGRGERRFNARRRKLSSSRLDRLSIRHLHRFGKPRLVHECPHTP